MNVEYTEIEKWDCDVNTCFLVGINHTNTFKQNLKLRLMR